MAVLETRCSSSIMTKNFQILLLNLPRKTQVTIFMTIARCQRSFSIRKFIGTSLQRSIATAELYKSLSCESALKTTPSLNVLYANEASKYSRTFANYIYSPIDDL